VEKRPAVAEQNCFEEYQNDVVRTLAEHPDKEFGLAILGLGLTGEAGEAADIIKKVVGHKHPLDEATSLKLLAELGDILWYVTAIAATLDIGLDVIVQYNVEKLRKRYPEGFSSERSLNRLDG
jgi:NTP pyrophosphatase (non-canonical NTP hydrolase)